MKKNRNSKSVTICLNPESEKIADELMADMGERISVVIREAMRELHRARGLANKPVKQSTPDDTQNPKE